MNNLQFYWFDAWILLSIIYGCANKKAIDLATIIEISDFIQHSILTLEELDEGLNRLINKGYVIKHENYYSISEEILSYYKRNTKPQKRVLKELENIEKFLNSKPYDLSYRPPTEFKNLVIEKKDYEDAVKEYQIKSK